jgi:hypothetical protein
MHLGLPRSAPHGHATSVSPSVPTRLLGLANGIALAAYIISLLYSSTRRLSRTRLRLAE